MGSYYWPNGLLTKPKVISAFGPRKPIWTPNGWSSSNHKGVDMIGFRVIRAIMSGIVVFVGVKRYWEGGGYGVWVRQDDGALVKYFHGVADSAYVKVGQRVSAKAALMIMGRTGTADVVHLHLEISPNGGEGGQVDPVPFISARLASTAGEETKPTPTPIPEEEDEMTKNSGAFYTRADNKHIVYLIYNTLSGFQHEFSAGQPGKPMSAAYNNALAKSMDTPSWASITEAHASVIKRGLANIRPKDFPGELAVHVISPEEEEDTIKAMAYHEAQAENEGLPVLA